MHTLLGLAGAAGAIAVLTACGTNSSGSTITTTPTSVGGTVTVTESATPASPSATPTSGPHFTTAEAAMLYLAAAYNADDTVELGHVTNPSARTALQAMRSGAINLRLVACTANPGRGDDTCQFDHDFPAGYTPASPDPEGPPPDGSHGGWAEFTVAPASAPGWYMTVLEHCD